MLRTLNSDYRIFFLRLFCFSTIIIEMVTQQQQSYNKDLLFYFKQINIQNSGEIPDSQLFSPSFLKQYRPR